MRVIKFRGKRIDNRDWVYGSLINNLFYKTGTGEVITYIVDPEKSADFDSFEDMEHIAVEVDPKTVGQYIGISDSNGKEIYEGDILQDQLGTGEVEYVSEHCAFVVFERNPSQYFCLESDGQLLNTKVVGNIGGVR